MRLAVVCICVTRNENICEIFTKYFVKKKEISFIVCSQLEIQSYTRNLLFMFQNIKKLWQCLLWYRQPILGNIASFLTKCELIIKLHLFPDSQIRHLTQVNIWTLTLYYDSNLHFPFHPGKSEQSNNLARFFLRIYNGAIPVIVCVTKLKPFHRLSRMISKASHSNNSVRSGNMKSFSEFVLGVAFLCSFGTVNSLQGKLLQSNLLELFNAQ